VLWANKVMLFSTTLFPYATAFVDMHFRSLVAQLVYGAVFVAVTLGNFGLYLALVRAEPENAPLRFAAWRPVKMGLDLGIKSPGIVIAIVGYPPAVTFSMVAAMLLFIVPERRAERSYIINRKEEA
jgi:uncharacterized membrane protein